MGTLTFHKTVGASGLEVIPFIARNEHHRSDDVLNLYGDVISDTTTFNSAYVIKTGVRKGAPLNDRIGEPRRCREQTERELDAASRRPTVASSCSEDPRSERSASSGRSGLRRREGAFSAENR